MKNNKLSPCCSLRLILINIKRREVHGLSLAGSIFQREHHLAARVTRAVAVRNSRRHTLPRNPNLAINSSGFNCYHLSACAALCFCEPHCYLQSISLTIVLVGVLASLKILFFNRFIYRIFGKWIFPSQKYLVSMAIFDKKLSLIILLVMPRHPKTGKRGKP